MIININGSGGKNYKGMTATSADVLSGKTFIDVNGNEATGSITQRNKPSISLYTGGAPSNIYASVYFNSGYYTSGTPGTQSTLSTFTPAESYSQSTTTTTLATKNKFCLGDIVCSRTQTSLTTKYAEGTIGSSGSYISFSGLSNFNINGIWWIQGSIQSNTYQSIHALYPISNGRYQLFLNSSNGTAITGYSLSSSLIEYSSSSSLEIELNYSNFGNEIDKDADDNVNLEIGSISWGNRRTNIYRLYYVGE